MRSATSLRFMCETALDMGVDQDACLNGTGLSASELSQRNLRVSLGQEMLATENFVRLSPQKVGLGFAVGERLHLGAFGIWGFAILTSPTLRAAIKTAIDFVNLSFVMADIALTENEDEARLEFDMSGLPTSIRPYVFERHCLVTMTFFRDFLRENQLTNFRICSSLADDTYAQQLSEMLKIDVVVRPNLDALTFPASMLEEPLPKADPVTQHYCINQCKTLVERVTGLLAPWSIKVRDLIVENIGADPKIETIAAQLNMTERTLRRRLQDEGVSFRQLYTDTRLTIARELLELAGLTVDTVAWRVGYAEPAAFVRAFSRKFGFTPGSVRGKAI
ncbi:MAG: AraC family transcriptional regulator ligand-binding domain-containing protein [Pseudomonadota bacterium]